MKNSSVFVPAQVVNAGVETFNGQQCKVIQLQEVHSGVDDPTKEFDIGGYSPEPIACSLVATQLPPACSLDIGDKVSILPVELTTTLLEMPTLHQEFEIDQLVDWGDEDLSNESESNTIDGLELQEEGVMFVDKEDLVFASDEGEDSAADPEADVEELEVVVENYPIRYLEISAIYNKTKCPECPLKKGCLKALLYEKIAGVQSKFRNNSNGQNDYSLN